MGSNYNRTPVEILRWYVSKARDNIDGNSDEIILDDDVTLNNMALLDDDTIFGLENDVVDEYLSTYVRQYNVKVDLNYYISTCLEQKRVQLTKSLLEYKQKFLKHEPIAELNEHTTDHMIESASLNMIKKMLENYIDSLDVAVEISSITNRSHIELCHECKTMRNKLRDENKLPPVPSALPSNEPTEFQKSVENQNGNLFSKYVPKSTTFIYKKQLANNNSGQLSNRFDQNDFYVRVSAPVKGKDVHIPTVIRLVFKKLQQADPSFLIMPFDRSTTTKKCYLSKS